MVIEPAHPEDAEAILALQKLAYLDEAAIHNEYNIPPLTQTLEGIADDFRRQFFLKASIDGQIIGSVRAHVEGDTCFVGRLIVHPEHQNKGIGTRLMRAIEERFPGAKRFELFTGYKSARNLHLYEKLGYRAFKTEPVTANLSLVYLEKLVES
ncbi:MAG: GNAT family N-acetyltransferase [Anaerolineae bacterium]|nr:GNAT family N-acetyltransferase [Anaerolineae bacterium]